MNQQTFSLCSEAKDTLESGYITANYNECAASGDRFHLLCSSDVTPWFISWSRFNLDLAPLPLSQIFLSLEWNEFYVTPYCVAHSSMVLCPLPSAPGASPVEPALSLGRRMTIQAQQRSNKTQGPIISPIISRGCSREDDNFIQNSLCLPAELLFVTCTH